MAKKVFNTPTEMSIYFNKILEQAIDEVSHKLLDYMHETLDETIYSAPPGEKYKRLREHGGFYSGWGIEKASQYVRELVFHPEMLALGEGQKSHMGDTEGDMRAQMPHILDDENLNDIHSAFMNLYGGHGAIYLTLSSGNGYWSKFCAGLDKKIIEWFDDALNKRGIRRG